MLVILREAHEQLLYDSWIIDLRRHKFSAPYNTVYCSEYHDMETWNVFLTLSTRRKPQKSNYLNVLITFPLRLMSLPQRAMIW